ncbi:MAG: winged helix DNA-binding domain-containing protein [Acidobacteriaceae bacterium]
MKKHNTIAISRLERQQLSGTEFTTPQEIVAWMGAMQAQDFGMAKWAIGARLPGSTDSLIEAAINLGKIIRTHVMRPTWHFVAAEDIYWMLDLTAANVKAAQSSRDRQLELTEEIYTRSNRKIENALGREGYLTRKELLRELQESGFAIDQNRSAHLLARAEAEKIICSGPIIKGKPSYALLSKMVPKKVNLSKEEALAMLARRYFSSHGPATLQDFSWWSGLAAADARHAIELVSGEINSESIDGRTYHTARNHKTGRPAGEKIHLLPTYDEYLVAYADRSASVDPKYNQHMNEISNRGMFWPIIVVNGQVEGIWKRSIKGDTIRINLFPFTDLNQAVISQVKQAAERYGSFFIKRVEVTLNTLPEK